jgi:hypothetical protein
VSTYIEQLKGAILHTHHVRCVHVGGENVRELQEGIVAWQGRVEKFLLIDHPTAVQCYAWGEENESGSVVEAVSILRVPPVTSSLTAVRAALAAGRCPVVGLSAKR